MKKNLAKKFPSFMVTLAEIETRRIYEAVSAENLNAAMKLFVGLQTLFEEKDGAIYKPFRVTIFYTEKGKSRPIVMYDSSEKNIKFSTTETRINLKKAKELYYQIYLGK